MFIFMRDDFFIASLNFGTYWKDKYNQEYGFRARMLSEKWCLPLHNENKNFSHDWVVPCLILPSTYSNLSMGYSYADEK